MYLHIPKINFTYNSANFDSIGLSLGLMKGDEIMVINGAIVSDLDMMFIESVLQEELTLCMMLRSSRPGKYS